LGNGEPQDNFVQPLDLFDDYSDLDKSSAVWTLLTFGNGEPLDFAKSCRHV